MGEMEKGCDWPYVVKPRWVHDLLLMWRRKQPYEPYLDQVTDYSVREISDVALRRRCVAWLANHFAPSRAASTLNQNVWASYSHHFRVNELASAYLSYLILRQPLARQVSTALVGQNAPGTSIGRSALANVKAFPGALDSLLRTLQQWEVLVADPRRGGYLVDRQLHVPVQTFPLLVWVWWLETRQPSITLAEFTQLPLWAWIVTDDFVGGWQHFAGRLWTVDTDGGEPTLYLHPTDSAGFTRSLLNLLSTNGHRGRQLPRHGEPGEDFAEAVSLSEGILGR